MPHITRKERAEKKTLQKVIHIQNHILLITLLSFDSESSHFKMVLQLFWFGYYYATFKTIKSVAKYFLITALGSFKVAARYAE